jgi:raffinose/stachyose/melibiose transport system permease protein
VSVFTTPAELNSIEHALELIFFFSVLPIAIGLVLAGLIGRDNNHSWRAARTLIFLPQVLPLVAVGVAWKSIYNPDGLLNQILGAVGLGWLSQDWLGSFTLAFPAVGLVGTWVCTGLCMILFLAGIQRIDHNLYEAVRLDGGGPIREFFTVTLRGLRGEISVAATITVISALASFDIVYVMTLGGPGTSTTVPGVQIYELAFSYNQVGLASALAIVLSLLVYAIVVAINILSRSRDN